LNWRNPGDAHFAGTLIRFKTTGYPLNAGDGELVVDQSAARPYPFTHTNLAN
jgi:hypothetical protein